MRTFVGVGLRPSHRAEFARIQSLLRPRLGDFRWVRQESAHLTLHFIGEMPRERLPDLQCALGDVACTTDRLQVEIGGVGAFPARGRVRAVWLGVNDPHGALAELAERIAVAAGAEPPTRYRPHVTLGRPRRGNRTDIRAALGSAGVESPAAVLTVRSFELVRSHLTPEGARYETLESYRLESG